MAVMVPVVAMEVTVTGPLQFQPLWHSAEAVMAVTVVTAAVSAMLTPMPMLKMVATAAGVVVVVMLATAALATATRRLMVARRIPRTMTQMAALPLARMQAVVPTPTQQAPPRVATLVSPVVIRRPVVPRLQVTVPVQVVPVVQVVMVLQVVPAEMAAVPRRVL